MSALCNSLSPSPFALSVTINSKASLISLYSRLGFAYSLRIESRTSFPFLGYAIQKIKICERDYLRLRFVKI